jgi:hypothetical protein
VPLSRRCLLCRPMLTVGRLRRNQVDEDTLENGHLLGSWYWRLSNFPNAGAAIQSFLLVCVEHLPEVVEYPQQSLRLDFNLFVVSCSLLKGGHRENGRLSGIMSGLRPTAFSRSRAHFFLATHFFLIPFASYIPRLWQKCANGILY